MKNMNMMGILELILKVITGSISMSINRNTAIVYFYKIIQSFDCVYDMMIECFNFERIKKFISGEKPCLVWMIFRLIRCSLIF